VHNASQQFRLEVGKAIATKVETSEEQQRIREYYAEMLKKKEEGAAQSPSSSPMEEEKTEVRLVLDHFPLRAGIVKPVLTLFFSYVALACWPTGEYEGYPLWHHVDTPVP